jgi:nucleotide-binding universal stress UspA family protein
VDSSPACRRALASLTDSGLCEGRPIHVASVADDGPVAWLTARRAVEWLANLGIEAFAHQVASALPTADALLELRARLGAGLVVMAAFGRDRLGEIAPGSTTAAMIEKAPVPLYLHH